MTQTQIVITHSARVRKPGAQACAVQLERVDRELRAMRDARPGCGQRGCRDSSAHVHAVQVARVLAGRAS